MVIYPVSCLQDNYAYVVFEPRSKIALVIDPCEGAPIACELRRLGACLSHILCTHHHADHVSGLEALKAFYPEAIVVASALDAEKIPSVDCALSDGELIPFAGTIVEAYRTPGHTQGSLVYVLRDEADRMCAFTGDTLFLAGCGRLFEGSADEMVRSLKQIASFSPDVLLYPGHEYTLANLRFANAVEPSNTHVLDRMALIEAQRARGERTVPGLLSIEYLTNPFLRLSVREVQAFAVSENLPEVDVFASLRKAKNAFRL